MAITNHERVGKAMELLRQGLGPFVEREVQEKDQDLEMYGLTPSAALSTTLDWPTSPSVQWDAAGLLKIMWETWNDVFRYTLGFAERSLVSEIRDWRNKWAHQEPFTSDDADRALDSMLDCLRQSQHPRPMRSAR
jgi:hypothetical protein